MRGRQQDRAASRHAGRSALYSPTEKVTMKYLPLIFLILSTRVESGTASESRIYAALPSRAAPSSPLIISDQSFKNEVQRAIDRGLDWLKANQNSNGWWSTPDHPAITALPITAFKGDPSKRYADSPFIKKGYAQILQAAKANGGIFTTNLPTYNTALAMMALVAANDPSYDPVLRKARAFLVGLQTDFGVKGKIDDVFDGGVGYGSS